MSALFESLTGLALRDPWMLLLALLVAPALWIRRRQGRPAVRFAPGAFLERSADAGTADGEIPRSWRVRLLPLPRTLEVLGLLVVVVALARPVHRVPEPRKAEGIDILLCLDVSSSMTANDLDSRRTRLDVAKDAAAEFIRGRPDDRIGLLTFARYPDVRCPLTLDHDALTTILSQVTTAESDGPEDATGIGAATARAAQVLRGGVAKSRVVILLTDGEENVATTQASGEIAPAHAAQLCRALGVRVYAIAAGADGAVGRAKIDTGPIERMAARTGGRFYAARDAGAVAGVYASIDALEKSEIHEPRFAIEDRFLPFLTAALALLLAGRALGSTIFAVLP